MSVATSKLIRWSEGGLAHLLYVLTFSALVVALPPAAVGRLWGTEGGALATFGVLAIWRYGWGLTHFTRSLVYQFLSFPRLRRRADAALHSATEGHAAPHAYFLVTSYKIEPDVSAAVYRAAFEAAQASVGGATVVASVVEVADQRLVKSLHRTVCGEHSTVALTIIRIKGTGKRDALAHGFRAIARALPKPNDVVVVVDGDSIVPADLVSKCAGFFLDNPRVGALTTDEISDVRGKAIYHLWYSLRFAQRHILMSSNGLARRVLTLTGRMSMFRASIACRPDFIAQVESDFIEHWRLGRIKFLTGDDKSTWFWLLRNRYFMLYVRDVQVATVESPPSEKFVDSAAQLMVRWFGNMLRTNGRALGLGPHRIGLFTWWAIFDQRISMWTSLAGLAMTLLIGVFVSPVAFLAYALWIVATRYVQALMLFQSRRRVSVLYPFLIYFNQIFGSMIKTYVFFRLNRQRWTRQGTRLTNLRGAWRTVAADASSLFMHVLAVAVFLAAVAWFVGILPFPDFNALGRVFG